MTVTEMMDLFVDTDFLDAVTSLLPAVGVGVGVGLIVMVIGWLMGFLWRSGQDKL